MFATARRWGLVTGGVAIGVAGVVGFTGSTASAEPALPVVPVPAPATVTQTVVVQAAPATAGITPVVAAQGPAAAPAAGLAATLPAGTLPAGTLPAPAAVPVAPAIAPAASGTVVDYLKSKNVALKPQVSAGFTALNIVLPLPQGWSHVPDPNVPDAFAVIADRVGGDGLYTPNAALVVYELAGDFDPKEAISHGFIENQQLPAWRSTDGSMADFGGLPSSIIEGTYRQNNMTLNTSRRNVIAQSGTTRYLVSLSVTTSAQVSVAAGNATDAIVNGFRVASPTAPAAAPAPLPGLPS